MKMQKINHDSIIFIKSLSKKPTHSPFQYNSSNNWFFTKNLFFDLYACLLYYSDCGWLDEESTV